MYVSAVSFKSVGTKGITILNSFLAVFTISQRKRHYKVCKSSNMHFKLYLACTKVNTQFFDNFHRFPKQSFLVQTLRKIPIGVQAIAMFTCHFRLVGIVPKFDQYSKTKTEA